MSMRPADAAQSGQHPPSSPRSAANHGPSKCQALPAAAEQQPSTAVEQQPSTAVEQQHGVLRLPRHSCRLCHW
jgi:hypothetical protein